MGTRLWHSAINCRQRFKSRLATATNCPLPDLRIPCQVLREIVAVLRIPQRHNDELMRISRGCQPTKAIDSIAYSFDSKSGQKRRNLTSVPERASGDQGPGGAGQRSSASIQKLMNAWASNPKVRPISSKLQACVIPQSELPIKLDGIIRNIHPRQNRTIQAAIQL